jgi:hypothetical protein
MKNFKFQNNKENFKILLIINYEDYIIFLNNLIQFNIKIL